MEKLGWYEFQIEGLSLERLLNHCTEQGIRLRRLQKPGARRITGRVAAVDLLALKALAESRGWRLTILGTHGAVRIGEVLRRRALLAAGALAFLVVCWGLLSCIWFIDVRGAGAYTGEIERILKEHEVHVGRFSFLLDTDSLEADMQRQLTGLAWVGINKTGVRLTVACVQAQLGQQVGKGESYDLVAVRDGVVASMTVRAGTPLVKTGDAVRRGQVLVRGEERAWNGAVTPIPAEASVQARVWYKAEASVPSILVESQPTGETFVRRTLCMPLYAYALEDAPDYETYDLTVDVLPIAGPLPVWLQIERYEEIARVEVARDENAIQEEAALVAYRLAQGKVPHGVRVVDKWVEYSMIEEEKCCATAVLEVIEEIAAAPEEVVW